MVKTVGDVEQLVNEDQMKKFVEDRYSGSAVELNYWRGGQCERGTIPQEREVEKITRFKILVDGMPIFLNPWRGQQCKAVWEPID